MGKGLVQQLWRDAIYGARALRREPSFAATALLTLTLGIGTTTTVFTLVDAELWKPLPFPDPSQLVAVSAESLRRRERASWSRADFDDWRAQARLAEYAAETASGAASCGAASPSRCWSNRCRRTIFGCSATHHGSAARSIPSPTPMIRSRSSAIAGWRRLFDADPQAIGAGLSLDDVDLHRRRGQRRAAFRVRRRTRLLHRLRSAERRAHQRSRRAILSHGPDCTRRHGRPGDARSSRRSSRESRQAYPDDRAGHGLDVADLRLAYSGYNWRPLYFLLAAAVAVLLLAVSTSPTCCWRARCRRQREFAIRGALGGGDAALARQLIVEGALLALPERGRRDAALDLDAARCSSRADSRRLPRSRRSFRPGRASDALRVGLPSSTTVLLSLAPVVFARRVDLNVTLGHGSRTGQSPRQRRVRSGLLVAQLTVTLVLVTGAGLFARSFLRLVDVPLGFEPRGSAQHQAGACRAPATTTTRRIAPSRTSCWSARARYPACRTPPSTAVRRSTAARQSGVAAGDRPRPVPRSRAVEASFALSRRIISERSAFRCDRARLFERRHGRERTRRDRQSVPRRSALPRRAGGRQAARSRTGRAHAMDAAPGRLSHRRRHSPT